MDAVLEYGSVGRTPEHDDQRMMRDVGGSLWNARYLLGAIDA